MQRWTRINISKEMAEYIEEIIKHPKIKKKYDFQSVADFVRAAVREKLDRLEKELKASLEEG